VDHIHLSVRIKGLRYIKSHTKSVSWFLLVDNEISERKDGVGLIVSGRHGLTKKY